MNDDRMTPEALADEINGAPSVDAVEVVHARWVSVEYPEIGDDGVHFTLRFSDCSRCSERVFFKFQRTPYCPNCGACMDAEEEKDG